MIEIDNRIDEIGLAGLLLDSTDDKLIVYVVQCDGVPKTVRRGIHTAMGYCQVTWDLFPDWVAPGYWKGEQKDESGMVTTIEIYQLKLEP